jgi:hypothetical protein
MRRNFVSGDDCRRSESLAYQIVGRPTTAALPNPSRPLIHFKNDRRPESFIVWFIAATGCTISNG